MANLGNIGKNFAQTNTFTGGRFFMLDKTPGTNPIMSGTGANASTTPFSFITLFRNNVFQQRINSDVNGEWAFNGMDDSGGQVYWIASSTQAGGLGEEWTATVSGSTVVLTKVFSSQRGFSAAFV